MDQVQAGVVPHSPECDEGVSSCSTSGESYLDYTQESVKELIITLVLGKAEANRQPQSMYTEHAERGIEIRGPI